VSGSRHRLGVALLLDPPVDDAVDGLRRALGDPSIGRVAAHLTLVPPVNVGAGQLPAALAAVRAAAAGQAGPLELTLGPPATFLPTNPVLYLDVGGDLDALRRLRDAVFVPPLRRALSWPWVPHVTLADSASEARIAAALAALDRFAVVTSVACVTVLEEHRGRVWRPLADAALGPPAVIGRGGLAVEITRGRVPDPEVHHLIKAAAADPGSALTARAEAGPWWHPVGPPIVLSARREGQVAGAGVAWRSDAGGQVAVTVAPGARRQGIGGMVLAHLEAAVRAAEWECPVLHAHGPAAFYQARSRWSVPGGPLRT
jgi:2'-5' RNA ligase/GNAT superfamily N-acetyltransferase